MSPLSIIAFFVVVHSLIVIINVLLNPEEYHAKAVMAGVKPSVAGAVIMKFLLIIVSLVVGFWNL